MFSSVYNVLYARLLVYFVINLAEIRFLAFAYLHIRHFWPFILISVYVSVKVPYFHPGLEQKRTKQKSCGKTFKIVLVLAYGRMPRKLQLTILGRIAYFINGFKNSTL